jgi:DNA-binding NarL/FixJ family response regulator
MDLPTKPWLRDDRVVVIARQTMTREFWARVFKEERGLSPECFATLDEWVDAGRVPDPCLVVLYQSGLVATDALAEVERLSAQAARCPIVIVPDNEDPKAIVQMLAKKVRGYVPTSFSLHTAMQAMDLVRAGGTFVPASSLIAAHHAPEDAQTGAQKSNGLFTTRQTAVIDALRRGKPNKIIAYELKMRESTVKVHVRNIMKKLHATNRTQVAYLATQLLEDSGGNDRLNGGQANGKVLLTDSAHG